MANLNIKALDFVITKSQLVQFEQKIETLKEEVFNQKFNLNKSLAELFTIEEKEKFLSLLSDNKINLKNQKDFVQFLTDLQEQLYKLNVVKLTIGFEPTESLVLQLASYFGDTSEDSKTILEIDYDPQIVAGVQIYNQGKFGDYSFKTLINKFYEQAKRATK